VFPFNLTGPQFLCFYAVLVALALWWLWDVRRRTEPTSGIALDGSDPYRVATLRGGGCEALRLAILSLVDRGILQVKAGTIGPGPQRSPPRRPIERALVDLFGQERGAPEAFRDPGCLKACELLRDDLVAGGLLLAAKPHGKRLGSLLLAILCLGALAGIRVALSLKHGHTNVFFLVLLAIGFAGAAVLVARPQKQRTRHGDAVLAGLRQRFEGLRERARALRPGGATSEVVLLGAVFGVGVLAAASPAFAFVGAVSPKGRGSSSPEDGSSGGACGSGSACGIVVGSGGGGGGCGGGCGSGCGGA
jgi:uncharacterized protein (TIGR04222 family)